MPESPDRDPSRGGAASALDPEAIARLRRLGGDVLTGKMASLLLELAPQRLRALRQGLDAGNHDAVRYAAHSLRSSAGNLGAYAILEAAGELEDAAEDGKPIEELSALFATVEAAFEATRPELVALAAAEERAT